MKKSLFIVALSLLLEVCSLAQVPVVIAPPPKLQFFDASGRPLSFGCVFTYESGTTTPLATYTTSGGTILNANPVPLNAGGFASGGSSGIWLQAGVSYTMKVVSSGGTNCAFGTTQYTIDGIGNGGSTLTVAVPFSATPSFVVQAQVELFTMTLTGNAAANPLTAVGVITPTIVVFQITQDSSGAHTWTWPSNVIGGSPIGLGAGQTTTQMFVWNGTNATAVGPANIGAGSSFSFQPGYLVLANEGATGTTLNKLAKLTGAPSTAIIAATTDTAGIQGICVAGCTTGGTALIQQGGNAQCVFDGATTAGDYVQISSTVAGDCSDAGNSTPGGQALGRVLSSNGGAGTYGISLFGPEISSLGTTIVIPNASSTGTTLNTLTKLTGAPSKAVVAAISDVSGVLGITISGAGTTGNAVIQQSGKVLCVFDGGTDAGDYVQISSTVAGNCHDLGFGGYLYYPGFLSTGVVGRVLTSSGIAGTFAIDLFPPENFALYGKWFGNELVTSITAGVGAGTSPTITCGTSSTTCFDSGGRLSVLTGSAPSSGTVVTFVLGNSSNFNSFCTFSAANSPSAAASTLVSLEATATGFIIQSSSGLTGTTTYLWDYTCTFH